ncbi:MAG: redox-sensing transcriptional repressor Rex, partial [Planctomycetota bacterium]
ASQVRKDLSMLGTLGTRGSGYRVDELERSLGSIFGRDHEWNVVLVGAGNLGRALLAHGGFEGHGFRIVAVFDADPSKVGTVIRGLTVQDVSRISTEVPLLDAGMAILAVPSHGVQWTAVGLQEAGVGAFLNFSGVPLQLGGGAIVSNVDMTAELEKLRYFLMLTDTNLMQDAGDAG